MSKIKSLYQFAAMNIQQKEWQETKKKYNLYDTINIDRIRFEGKKKNIPEFEIMLENIKNKQYRHYNRASLLNKIDKYKKQLYHQLRVPIPNVSQSIQAEFIYYLNYENPNEVYTIFKFYNNKNYMVYYIKTPLKVSKNRSYPENTILKVIFYDDSIIDIEEIN